MPYDDYTGEWTPPEGEPPPRSVDATYEELSRLYLQYLGRAMDPSEMSHYAGVSLPQAAASIQKSKEAATYQTNLARYKAGFPPLEGTTFTPPPGSTPPPGTPPATPPATGTTYTGATPQGWSGRKWNDASHQSAKYVIGRILMKYPPTPAGLQAAKAEIEATGLATVVGTDKLRLTRTGEVGDVGSNFNSGKPSTMRWHWGFASDAPKKPPTTKPPLEGRPISPPGIPPWEDPGPILPPGIPPPLGSAPLASFLTSPGRQEVAFMETTSPTREPDPLGAQAWFRPRAQIRPPRPRTLAELAQWRAPQTRGPYGV